MRRIKHAEICLFVLTITNGGAALATCPNTMSLKLLVDCIVYERDGSSYPTSDYAYMDRYQDLAEDTGANSNNSAVYSKVCQQLSHS
jgi:hypothetical protein